MSRICIPIPSSTVIGVSSSSPSTPNEKTVRNESQITSLTGGTATDLDGIPTTGASSYPLGISVFVVIGGTPAIYQLVTGTNDHNPPSVVRPADYSGANTKVWIQRM